MVGQWNHLCNLKPAAVLLLFHTAFISCVPLPESAECTLDKEILMDLGSDYLREAINDAYPKIDNEV
jgi:hypothetical protein